jgi:hypothetical protein
MTQAAYVASTLALFRSLPGTSGRTGPADRRLARDLYSRGVSLEVLRAALVLGAARRSNSSAPLPPIRSLAYFRPLIDELLAGPVDTTYIAYIERTLTSTRRSDSCRHQVQKNAVP